MKTADEIVEDIFYEFLQDLALHDCRVKSMVVSDSAFQRLIKDREVALNPQTGGLMSFNFFGPDGPVQVTNEENTFEINIPTWSVGGKDPES